MKESNQKLTNVPVVEMNTVSNSKTGKLSTYYIILISRQIIVGDDLLILLENFYTFYLFENIINFKIY